MKFSTLFTVLPVLALAAPALGSPVAKKRACTRPSASASVSAPASSVAASASASAVSSAVESASASVSSAVESASATASPISSVNTGVFAPEPTGDSSSAELEPTSASASEQPASSTSSAEPAASSAASGDSTDADLFVQLHNDLRAQYGAPPVEWDEELASYARDYAPICKMQHSDGPYGENLAGGAGGGYDITRAFQSWASEGDHYDWNQPGVLSAVVDGETIGLGHFTQAVWKSTTKIGCAAVSCADGTLFTGYGESLYVVCEYAPAGNVYLSSGDANALFVENVGTKVA